MKCVYVSDLKTKTFKTSNGTLKETRYYELTLISSNGYPIRERVGEDVLIDFGLSKPNDLIGLDINLYFSKRSFIKDNKPNVFYYVSLIQQVSK